MTSSSFRLRGSVGQIAIGESNAANFSILSGFLYFRDAAATPPPPTATSPSASSVAKDSGGILRGILHRGIPSLLPVLKSVLCRERITDLDCDGHIGLRDLSIFLFHTKDARPSIADFNQDARTDAQDLSMLLSHWTESVLTMNKDQDGEGVEGMVFDRSPRRFHARQNEFAGVSESIGARKFSVEKKIEEATTYGISKAWQTKYKVQNFLKIMVMRVENWLGIIFSKFIPW